MKRRYFEVLLMINSKPTPQKVLGYVDLEERIGFSNKNRYGETCTTWSCYDLDSGRMICQYWTKVGCENKFLEVKELVIKMRNSKRYLEELERRKLNESI